MMLFGSWDEIDECGVKELNKYSWISYIMHISSQFIICANRLDNDLTWAVLF